MTTSYNGQHVPLWSKESLTAVLSEVRNEDIPWAIRFLVDKLADRNQVEPVESQTHVWDSYQLSPEILDMMPPTRQHVARDYKEVLTNVLEHKYR